MNTTYIKYRIYVIEYMYIWFNYKHYRWGCLTLYWAQTYSGPHPPGTQDFNAGTGAARPIRRLQLWIQPTIHASATIHKGALGHWNLDRKEWPMKQRYPNWPLLWEYKSSIYMGGWWHCFTNIHFCSNHPTSGVNILTSCPSDLHKSTAESEAFLLINPKQTEVVCCWQILVKWTFGDIWGMVYSPPWHIFTEIWDHQTLGKFLHHLPIFFHQWRRLSWIFRPRPKVGTAGGRPP